MAHALFINAERQGYAIDQIRNTMTVGELISYLEQFEEDTPVILSHDNGYTFGGINFGDFREEEEETEEETEGSHWE